MRGNKNINLEFNKRNCTFPSIWNIEIREYGIETSRMVSEARGTERSQPIACKKMR